ncbi:MAG: ASKHA domain-containing protein [Oscillospiraceae bacterium]|nr:ASKHA domain-containing protein [Oscillospiraceae bacterium]
MPKTDACLGNCLICGKCGRFSILETYEGGAAGLEARPGFGAAIDIGTTSAVLALLDLETGKTLARHSFMNPQRAYGPDVISRIHAANGGALPALRGAITEALGEGLRALMDSRGIRRLEDTVIACNTVMAHLLLGFSCESLGVSPFQPAHRLKEVYDLSELFTGLHGPARIVPWLSAFVGGDIAAGILYVMPRGARRFLLADLGTNGELALFDGGKVTVTSTAAGPAFEGSGRPGGASKVLDDLAALVRRGLVDETGRLSDESVFTQKEIRGLQLAKSAVRTGIEVLGLSGGELDAVYLAGGIGQAMKAESAADVGLLPSGMVPLVRAVGNASLGGAARLLLSPGEAAADLRGLTENVTEINLAAHPRFQELFMEHMAFGNA